MPRESLIIDRRQFGRRQTLWHAWIKVAGREREPCIVRNFSVAGALLEFGGLMPVADRFRLVIDVYRFEAECYVRHRSRVGLGVNFDEFALPDATAAIITPEDLVERLRRGATARRH